MARIVFSRFLPIFLASIFLGSNIFSPTIASEANFSSSYQHSPLPQDPADCENEPDFLKKQLCLASNFGDAVKDVAVGTVTGVASNVVGFGSTVKDVAVGTVTGVASTVSGVVGAVGNAGAAVSGAVGNAGAAVGAVGNAVGNAGAAVVANPVGVFAGAAGAAVSGAVGAVGNAVGNAVASGVAALSMGLVNSLLASAVTGLQWAFVSVPSQLDAPGLNGGSGVDVSGAMVWVGWAKWLSFGLAMVSIVVLAVLLGLRVDHRDVYLGRLFVVVVAVLLISVSSTVVTSVVTGTLARGVNSISRFVSDSFAGWTLLASVLGFILAAARIIWSGRAEPAKELGKSLLTLLVVCSLGGSVVATALAAGDSFASQMLAPAFDCTSDNSACLIRGLFVMNKELADSSKAGLVSAPLAVAGQAVFTLLLTLFLFLALLVQVLIITARAVIVPVLVGFLPLAAASSVTRLGQEWLQKMVAWLGALVLYKPVVAVLIFVGQLLMVKSAGMGFIAALLGPILLLLTSVCLPVLLSLLTPGSSHSGGGGSLGLAGAGVMSMSYMMGGLPGPSGAKGADGLSGAAGASGAVGAAGASGAAGVSGAAGGPVGAVVGAAAKGFSEVKSVASQVGVAAAAGPSGASGASR